MGFSYHLPAPDPQGNPRQDFLARSYFGHKVSGSGGDFLYKVNPLSGAAPFFYTVAVVDNRFQVFDVAHPHGYQVAFRLGVVTVKQVLEVVGVQSYTVACKVDTQHGAYLVGGFPANDAGYPPR